MPPDEAHAARIAEIDEAIAQMDSTPATPRKMPSGAAKLAAIVAMGHETPEQRAARVEYDRKQAEEYGAPMNRLAWGRNGSIREYDRPTSDPSRRLVRETPRAKRWALIAFRDRRKHTPRQMRHGVTQLRSPREPRRSSSRSSRGRPAVGTSSRSADEPAPPGLLRVAAGTWRWARIVASMLAALWAVPA